MGSSDDVQSCPALAPTRRGVSHLQITNEMRVPLSLDRTLVKKSPTPAPRAWPGPVPGATDDRKSTCKCAAEFEAATARAEEQGTTSPLVELVDASRKRDGPVDS